MMRHISFGRNALVGLVVLGCLLVGAGCGDGLSGDTYTGEGLINKIEFKSGGKVYVTGFLDQVKEGTYTVDGDKISITIAGDNSVLTKEKDGTISGPLGMTLKKAS